MSEPTTAAALCVSLSGITEWYCFRRKGHEGLHQDYTTHPLVPADKQCHALFTKPEAQAEARQQTGSALRPALLRRLRRIVSEARHTYVGTHWPSMREMRIDGVGFGLVDNAKDEVKIRRFLDAFSPEMMVDILAALPPSARLAEPDA